MGLSNEEINSSIDDFQQSTGNNFEKEASEKAGNSIVHAHSQSSLTERHGRSILRTPSLPVLVATRRHDEVPVLFRESHVWQGFRAPHQPWGYYALSFFQLHNESMNVWTHALASVLLARQVYGAWEVLWSARAWPFVASLSCTLTLYIASTCAHWFQSRSHVTHYTCFLIDYAAVGLYTFGSALLHSEYCATSNLRSPFYLPIAGTLAVAICVGSALAKTRYSRPYPLSRRLLQAFPVCAAYATLITPLVPRLLPCLTQCENAAWFHLRHIGWFVAAAVAYICELPQRWLPGKCDHFFHSHQLFHVFIMLSSLAQNEAVLADFRNRGAVGIRASPSIVESFAPVLIIMLVQALCIAWFRSEVKKKHAQEAGDKNE